MSDRSYMPTEEAPADGERRKRPFLLVLVGDKIQRRQLPEEGALTIGRAKEADIRILDSSISRNHATLYVGDGNFIEDCGSRNGVKLGGRKLSPGEKVALRPGEIVELGEATLVLQDRSVTQVPWQIWDHGYFEARLISECARRDPSFAVMLIHVTGSAPGKAVEDALASRLRSGDVVAVGSPNEYECLILDASPPEVEAICQQLTGHLGRHASEVSIGVAGCPQDGREASTLVAKARAAVHGETEEEASALVVIEEGAMQGVFRLAEHIAPSNINVLIQGETGVGKEVVARRIHQLSGRPEHLYVGINCAAVPAPLLESELFGHVRGAFTGAEKDKPGLFESVGNGTILLDEIGEMVPTLQAKLLRVLEERKAVPIGGVKPYEIEARFIATTNRDLERDVQQGRFRNDLYFRLDGISLFIPPLRERLAEIEPLTVAFLRQACRRHHQPREPTLSGEALSWLKSYWWPGNIRELRNVVERAVLLCGGGQIAKEHVATDHLVRGLLHPHDQPRPAGQTLKKEIQEVERQRIIDALEMTGGNQTKAAELLGVSRRTLVYRLKTYNIKVARKRRGKKQ